MSIIFWKKEKPTGLIVSKVNKSKLVYCEEKLIYG
jgi:hypothetical protein